MTPAGTSAGDAVRALTSPTAFSEVHFGWTPFPYQRDVMNAVLLEGKTRVAWVAGRRAGKTETVANIALQKAIREPGTEVAVFAPGQRQARVMMESIRDHLEGSRFQANLVADKADEIRLAFGRDARGKPVESVFTAYSLGAKVRGRGADLLVVDESAFCDSEDYRNKALPFIADRAGAVVIHISTVWADDDHFSDALREFAEDPKRGAVFNHPSHLNPHVTQEYLEDMRRTMTDSEYRREFLCELVPESGVFDRRLLKACLRDYELLGIAELAKLEPKRHHVYAVGVDWGKKQDRAVIAVVEQGTQEKHNPARLVLLQVYPPDPDNPAHYSRVLDDVVKVAKQVKAQHVLADEGEGAHQAEVLGRALGRVFRGFRFTSGSRDGLVNNARLLVDRKALELPFAPEEVRRAFAGVYRKEERYEHTSRDGKDVFDAIALALQPVGDATAAAERGTMKLAVPGDAVGIMMGIDRNRKPGPWDDPALGWVVAEMRPYIRRTSRKEG